MTAKEYLSQACHLDDSINTKIQLLDSLNALATKCTTTYSDMPKSPSVNNSRMEDTIIRIIELENEINEEIDKLVELKAEIRRTIMKVEDPLQRLILEKRYLCRKTWSEIAAELYYDERCIYRVHGKALIEVQQIIDGSVG